MQVLLCIARPSSHPFLLWTLHPKTSAIFGNSRERCTAAHSRQGAIPSENQESGAGPSPVRHLLEKAEEDKLGAPMCLQLSRLKNFYETS